MTTIGSISGSRSPVPPPEPYKSADMHAILAQAGALTRRLVEVSHNSEDFALQATKLSGLPAEVMALVVLTVDDKLPRGLIRLRWTDGTTELRRYIGKGL